MKWNQIYLPPLFLSLLMYIAQAQLNRIWVHTTNTSTATCAILGLIAEPPKLTTPGCHVQLESMMGLGPFPTLWAGLNLLTLVL
jgi:hypothetical protein